MLDTFITRLPLLLSGMFMLCLGTASAAEPCQPGWVENQFCSRGVTISLAPGAVEVNAAVPWDDGSGESLYIAGNFRFAQCSEVNAIAKLCGTNWCALDSGSNIGLNNTAHALTVFDNGSGPALFVAGEFTTAGGLTVNRIAKWDGVQWSPLSTPGGTGLSGSCYALAVFDDGTGPKLFAAGRFTTASGVIVNNIARWDGAEWTALEDPTGIGVNGDIYALTVFNDGSGPALYIGGNFTSAGGVTVANIAKWDGTEWSSLATTGADLSGSVRTLTVFDNGTGSALYAGGQFESAGGATVNRIAQWTGSQWIPLAGPSGIGVSSGGFSTASVDSLVVHDDGSGSALYVGGFFTTAGGEPAFHIARWDGAFWTRVVNPDSTEMGSTVKTLLTYDDGSGPALYAGGRFTSAARLGVDRIAKWDGDDWSPAITTNAPGGVGNRVYALTSAENAFDLGPSLYAGGNFFIAGDQRTFAVARWNGSQWSSLSQSSTQQLDGEVYALSFIDDGSPGGLALYAGGFFRNAAGQPANGIARWDGTQWSALAGPDGVGFAGGNPLPYANAIAAYNDNQDSVLYAGGRFNSAGGVTTNNIALWDGMQWSALPGPAGVGVTGPSPGTRVNALAVFDDGSGPALYIGGLFTTAGDIAASNIARWDGDEWSAVVGPHGQGTDGVVDAIAVYDDGTGPALYIAGNFATAGGTSAFSIARWDGTNWSSLDGTSGSGVFGRVFALSIFDDDANGRASLFVGGNFTVAGGLSTNSIARWDGEDWSTLDALGNFDLQGSLVETIMPFETENGINSGLYIAGSFTKIESTYSQNIAIWKGCPFPCPGDITGDGTVGLDDFGILALNFGTGPGATLAQGDLNGDGFVNLADFNILAVNFGNSCR